MRLSFLMKFGYFLWALFLICFVVVVFYSHFHFSFCIECACECVRVQCWYCFSICKLKLTHSHKRKHTWELPRYSSCCCHHWLCLHMYKSRNVSPTFECLLHDYSLQFLIHTHLRRHRHTHIALKISGWFHLTHWHLKCKAVSCLFVCSGQFLDGTKVQVHINVSLRHWVALSLSVCLLVTQTLCMYVHICDSLS